MSDEKDEANEKSIYSVSSKTVNIKVQRAIDPEVAALLDDSDLSRFGSDVEDLEEDFIIQANRSEEGLNLGIDKKLNLVEESKIDHEVIDDEENHLSLVSGDNTIQDAGNDGVVDKPRIRRLVDEQFDLVRLFTYSYFYFLFVLTEQSVALLLSFDDEVTNCFFLKSWINFCLFYSMKVINFFYDILNFQEPFVQEN